MRQLKIAAVAVAITRVRLAIGRVFPLARVSASLLALLICSSASADEPKPSPPGSWGFSGIFGTGGAGGDFGNLLTKPVTWEYTFFREKGPWRAGLGLTFASFKMKEPYQDELEWGYQQLFLFGTRTFNTQGTLRPYIQVRGGLTRLRPRSELFKMDPLPPDFVSGQATQAKTDGFGFGVVPGLELKLGRAAYLDTSLSFQYFSVADYDLSPVGLPPAGSGTVWEGRLGITWFPNGEQQGEGSEGGPRDAWGVKRSYGWAAGEVLAINNFGGVAAQWVRNVDWSETSPRSWWQNIKNGFQYDPDMFKTNQWTHPFNGAAYYNSSRANGLGFWPSAGFALGGAFEWEMGGETQAMSLNDMFSTVLGGIAVGEAQYRLSSEILDNQARGMKRFLKEFGAFFVDPVREFNRIITGDATRVAANPVDPMDWRPANAQTFFATGVRVIGQESSLSTDTKTYGLILLNYNYGDKFDNPRRKPFDFVDFIGELNLGADVALSNVQIRGDLASWPLGGSSSPNHVLALVQYFDYKNNPAYVFGGQSLGAALSSRFRLSNRVELRTRLDGYGILLGAVNAEYSHLADVANPERLREYDYGPGLGATARAELVFSRRHLLSASYRYAWISATNGSVYEKGNLGLDANHYIQGADVRLVIPVKGSFGIGSDFSVFLRNSAYVVTQSTTGREVTEHVRQHNPQLRVYLAYDR